MTSCRCDEEFARLPLNSNSRTLAAPMNFCSDGIARIKTMEEDKAASMVLRGYTLRHRTQFHREQMGLVWDCKRLGKRDPNVKASDIMAFAFRHSYNQRRLSLTYLVTLWAALLVVSSDRAMFWLDLLPERTTFRVVIYLSKFGRILLGISVEWSNFSHMSPFSSKL